MRLVERTHYSLIDYSYENHLTGWFNGDYDYDGSIDGSDYTLIDNAFNSQSAAIVDGGAGILPDPRNLAATTFSSTEIDLSWIDDASSADAADEIYVSTDSGSTFNLLDYVASVAAGSTNTCQVQNLNPGTYYTFAVSAVNGVGYSTQVSSGPAQTLPAIPTSLSATYNTNDTVTLTWDGVVGATEYVVEHEANGSGWSQIGTSTSASFTDPTPAAFPVNSYQVCASDAGGNSVYSDSIDVSTIPNAPLYEPGALVSVNSMGWRGANSDGTSTVNVTWAAASGNFDSYLLERSTDPTFDTYTEFSTTNTSYTDASLPADTTYYYRLLLHSNSAGNSAPSPSCSVVTAPVAPTDLQVVSITNTGVNLTWTDNSTTESVFGLNFQTYGSSTWHSDFAGIADANAENGIFSNDGNGQTITCRLIASGPNGKSLPSNTISFVTQSENYGLNIPTVSTNYVGSANQSTYTWSVSRTGNTSTGLTIPFSVSGDPIPGTDYTLSTGSADYGGLESVTIPAGQSSTLVTITRQPDFWLSDTGNAEANLDNSYVNLMVWPAMITMAFLTRMGR